MKISNNQGNEASGFQPLASIFSFERPGERPLTLECGPEINFTSFADQAYS